MIHLCPCFAAAAWTMDPICVCVSGGCKHVDQAVTVAVV